MFGYCGHDLANYTDVELDILGRQRGSSKLLKCIPGPSLEGGGEPLFDEPVGRVRYDGTRWSPVGFLENFSTTTLEGMTVPFQTRRGLRLAAGCVPSFFLSDRASSHAHDFGNSMSVSGQTLSWGFVVRASEVWIRVPFQGEYFLVKLVDGWSLTKFQQLEVGIRYGSEVSRLELPIPLALEFELPFGIPYQSRDLARKLTHQLGKPVEAVLGGEKVFAFTFGDSRMSEAMLIGGFDQGFIQSSFVSIRSEPPLSRIH